MSGGITAGTLLTAAAVGVGTMAVTKMMAPDAPKAPKPPKPVAPPQATQAPDEVARRTNAATAGAAGGPAASSTLLTGSGGVSNDMLNLGKNVLLGGTK